MAAADSVPHRSRINSIATVAVPQKEKKETAYRNADLRDTFAPTHIALGLVVVSNL